MGDKVGVRPKKAAGGARTADQERRKGIPWTEEEHRLFLLGLAKFGKGDWRSIRCVVVAEGYIRKACLARS